MRHLLVAGLLTVSAGTTSAQALTEGTKSIRFTPCSSWTYSPDANGYICSFTGFREEVPDMMEFRNLEQRVADLEQRILDLEAKLAAALER